MAEGNGRAEWARVHAAAKVRATELDRAAIPDSPGVYVWFLEGEATYVGKATNLKTRLRTHLKTDIDLSRSAFRRNVLEHLGAGTVAAARKRPTVLTPEQVERVNSWVASCDVAWVACGSVGNASELEAALLREYKPPLNRAGG